MNKEFYILLSTLLFVGFGTAAVIFFHDDSRNKDPMMLVQQEVCLKLQHSAIRLFQNHQLFEAEAETRRLLKLDPENREMALFFGRILFETGRRQEAEKIFQAQVSISPFNVGARNNLAVIAAARQQYEAAAKIFSTISNRDNIRRVAENNLAVVKKAIELTDQKRNFAIVPESGKIDFRTIGAISIKLIELPPERE